MLAPPFSHEVSDYHELFYPTLYLQSIACLQPAQLQRWGVRGLILDVDNTLTTHDNPVPHPEVLIWLEQMRSAGIAMIILSNNHPPRVKPFAELLGLPLYRRCRKASSQRIGGQQGI